MLRNRDTGAWSSATLQALGVLCVVILLAQLGAALAAHTWLASRAWTSVALVTGAVATFVVHGATWAHCARGSPTALGTLAFMASVASVLVGVPALWLAG
jgi:hypothetical protein